eukprot:m.91016 g.91016  ORF g.91016 m.91016 type:complete len:74 (+) comp13286_c0_seq4:651-872(+)
MQNKQLENKNKKKRKYSRLEKRFGRNSWKTLVLQKKLAAQKGKALDTHGRGKRAEKAVQLNNVCVLYDFNLIL